MPKNRLFYFATFTVTLLLAADFLGCDSLKSANSSAEKSVARIGMADAWPTPLVSAANNQIRFNLYKQVGIGMIRVDYGWSELEVSDGNWQPYPGLSYLQLAVQNGFTLNINVGAMSAPPAWFFTANPSAKFAPQASAPAQVQENFAISYWYPGIYTLLEQKDDYLFSTLQAQGLLSSISYLTVPFGPAGEAIYGASWTTSAPGQQYFWCYDVNAVADFVAKMTAKYTTIAAANTAWGTNYANWAAVSVPQPGAQPGQMWADVLTWYRDTRRNFVTWQLQHYQALLQKYYPNGDGPKLEIQIPGSHYTDAEWQSAVTSGAGDANIAIMTDTSFLLDAAYQANLAMPGSMIVHPDGLPEQAELQYITAYMRTNNYKLPLRSECAGGQSDATEFANEVVANGISGTDYINAATIMNADTITPNGNFANMSNAYTWLLNLWSGQTTLSSVTFNVATSGFSLLQGQCIFADAQMAYTLCLTTDANLVVAHNGASVWSSNTGGQNCTAGNCHADLQTDGNFVVYNGASSLFATNTSKAETSPAVAYQLLFSNHLPYLEIIDGTNVVLWSSGQ